MSFGRPEYGYPYGYPYGKSYGYPYGKSYGYFMVIWGFGRTPVSLHELPDFEIPALPEYTHTNIVDIATLGGKINVMGFSGTRYV